MKSDMLLSDYLSTFKATDFRKYLINYIRTKETLQFNEEIARYDHTHNMLVRQINQVNKIHLDNNLFSQEFDQNTSFSSYENYEQEIEYKNESSKLWLTNVLATLDYCTKNNRIKELFTNHNRILKLHIDHKIFLDPHCFMILIRCTKPKLIAQVFDKALIRQQHLPLLRVLLAREVLFSSLKLIKDPDHTELLAPLIYSLTVFMYKVRCKKSVKSILGALYHLAVFVNRASNRSNRMQNWQSSNTDSVKQLLKSVYLNGIFSKRSMNRFLSFKKVKVEEVVADGEWPVSESEEDEDEVDENNNQASGRVAIGERIESVANTREIGNMFVMSLKNLARIQVKECMVEYSTKSVGKLVVLPRELKRFVLFEDEINAVNASL